MKFLSKYWHFLIILLFSFTPIIWFIGKKDVILNGVDTNFPLNPVSWFLRRFFTWNAVSNAGSDFSASTAGLFFHLIQVVPYFLGFNLQIVQIISLIFWFSVIVFSSFFLATKILPSNRSAQILFVCIYSFNTYLFNTWENAKVSNLSLVAAIPLALATLLLGYSKKSTAVLFFALTAISGVIVSGTGINPAYFISFFLVTFIFVLTQIISDFSLEAVVNWAKKYFLFSVIVVGINLFWIIPSVNFISKNIPLSGSITKIGFTNWVDSLSENTSLLNVFRIQGAWDWYAFDSKTGNPLYIPYAQHYLKGIPFVSFSFVLSILVITSFLFIRTDNRKFYLTFSLMLILGLFFGAGSHPPTGGLFKFFSNYIPFFSLFRSPWYIFTPILTLAFAGLISLFFYNISGRFKKSTFIIPIIVLILVGLNLIYTYPLVLGRIFRPDRADTFYVKFPSYVYDAGNSISHSNEGRIINYPDDEIEKFSWGYIGIESILQLVTNNEVLFAPLNLPEAPISQILTEFYQSLKRDQSQKALNLASKLNANKIFYKLDQPSLSPPLSDKFTNLPSQTFGKWQFYNLPLESQKIHAVKQVYFGSPYEKSSKMMGVLGSGSLLLNSLDTVIKTTPTLTSSKRNIIVAENSQMEEFYLFQRPPYELSSKLKNRDLSKVNFNFYLDQDGIYQIVLDSYKLGDFLTNLDKIEIEKDGVRGTLEVDHKNDSSYFFKGIEFSKGQHKITLSLLNQNLIADSTFDRMTPLRTEGIAEATIISEEDERYISIFNKGGKDASLKFFPSSFDPQGIYYIQTSYKQIYGDNAAILVGQSQNDMPVKHQVEPMPNYPEWNTYGFYYLPVKTKSDFSILLLAAMTKDPLGTKILYDNLKVFRIFTNDMFLIGSSDNKAELLGIPNTNFTKKSPVLYEGTITDASEPHVLVFAENFSPQWEIQLTDYSGKRLNVKPPHFSGNFYANAWYLENMPQNYKAKIVYTPQSYYQVGLTISLIVLILSIVAGCYLVFKLGRRVIK